MKARWPWLFAMMTIAVAPVALTGQSFEGVIRQRTIEVGENELVELMDDLYAPDQDEPDFDSEEEWIAYVASRLFDVPIERFVADRLGEVTEVTTWVKGNRFRSDISAVSELGYTILDGESGEMFMVNPDERWYVRMSKEEMDAMVEDAMRQMAAEMGIDLEEMRRMTEEMEMEMDMGAAPSRIRDLGETRQVAGMRGAGREAVSSEEAVRAWCAVQNPDFADALATFAEQMGFDEDDMEDEGGPALEDLACEDKLPLLVQTYMPYGGMGGGSYSIDEYVSFEETSVDDDVFEIPDGYEEKSMSDLWGVGGR